MRISDWSSDVCSSDLSSSNHPLAQAIVCHIKAAGILTPAASDAFATAGKAAHATVGGRPLAIGTPVYAAQAAALSPEQHAALEALKNNGKTGVALIEEQVREGLGPIGRGRGGERG